MLLKYSSINGVLLWLTIFVNTAILSSIYRGIIMHEIQENILQQFKSFVEQNKITVVDAESKHGNDISYYYSIPYTASVAKFISSLTGVSYTFIQQYVAANQFLIFLQDFDTSNIQVNFIFEGNNIEIDFRYDNGFNFVGDINDVGFLAMALQCLNTTNISNLNFTVFFSRLTMKNPDDYEVAYMDTLAKISELIDPSITTFQQVLHIHEQPTLDVLNSRLINSDFKAISLEDFKSRYFVEDSELSFTGNSVITVDYKKFSSFLKDNYSNSFANKLKQIASLSAFQEKFLKRNIQWHSSVANDFSISFENVSKYSGDNLIHGIYFGAMPHYSGRCTLFLNDNGTIDFCTEGSVWLHDLESIYDYIKEDFILKMERHLKIDREEFRLPHLKVYEMAVL